MISRARGKVWSLGVRLAQLAPFAKLWDWQLRSLAPEVLYLGPAEERATAAAMLGVEPRDVAIDPRDTTTLVTRARIPGALRVPCRVQMVVPLGRPIDVILSHFDDGVHRRIRRLRHGFFSREAKDPNEIEQLIEKMIVPFHTEAEVDRDRVRELSLGGAGRLDVLFRDQTIIGCRVAEPRIRADGRFWVIRYEGYDARTLSDRKRLDDARSMNAFMALEHALDEGYSYFDLGDRCAAPLAPNVQWRRARWGLPIALETRRWLSVLLPRQGSARFLWQSPLFAVDGHHLSVHVGLPEDREDGELVERCRPLRFDGLMRLHVHAERELDPSVRDALRALYDRNVERTEVVIHRAF